MSSHAAGITQGTIRLSVGLEDVPTCWTICPGAEARAKDGLRWIFRRSPGLYAYTGGRPFDPARPTVVFLHGGEHDHSVWSLQSRYLAHHGYSVLALDLPGHMRSAGPALNSIEVDGRTDCTAL